MPAKRPAPKPKRRGPIPGIGAFFGKTPTVGNPKPPTPGKPVGQGASTWRKPMSTDSKTGTIDDRRKRKVGPRRPTSRPLRGGVRTITD